MVTADENLASLKKLFLLTKGEQGGGGGGRGPGVDTVLAQRGRVVLSPLWLKNRQGPVLHLPK